MPTVASLCAKLGASLRPVHPSPALDIPIAGVHVSDLDDPTPYLRGGELLLSTGLLLPVAKVKVDAYVRRLRSAGIAALGFGLGPVHDSIPPALVDACRETGLSLLSVPAPVPFQEISTAYWQELRVNDQRELVDALGAQADLVRAASSDDPTLSLLKGLAGRMGGWAAHLWPDATVRRVWPEESMARVVAIQPITARLVSTRERPAAAFPVGDDEVVVQGIPSSTSGAGLLATGSVGRPTSTQRSLVSTTAVLLGLVISQGAPAREPSRTEGSMLARLLRAGHIDAAIGLAAETRHLLPTNRVRIVAFAGKPADPMLHAIETAWGATNKPLVAHVDAGAGWCIVADDDGAANAAVDNLSMGSRNGSVLIGRPAPLPLAVRLVPSMIEAARSALPGTVKIIGGRPGTDWLSLAEEDLTDLLQPITEGAQERLAESLAAYLRHRGNWEAAARELGVHRNTMRNRMQKARNLLGKDLDDPDFAAVAWLALRSTGHA